MNARKATTRNILVALESQKPVTVKHHINGAVQVDDAKPLGFGSNSVMVRLWRSTGWITIDPLTWEIV